MPRENRYRVVAGSDSVLRSFPRHTDALIYGKGVVCQSHPNIGHVVIERLDPYSGEWYVTDNLGIPKGRI